MSRLWPAAVLGRHDAVRVSAGARAQAPLLLVLAVVEISDVVFAVDSIPAVRRGLCTRSLGSSLGLSLAPGNAAV